MEQPPGLACLPSILVNCKVWALSQTQRCEILTIWVGSAGGIACCHQESVLRRLQSVYDWGVGRKNLKIHGVLAKFGLCDWVLGFLAPPIIPTTFMY